MMITELKTTRFAPPLSFSSYPLPQHFITHRTENLQHFHVLGPPQKKKKSETRIISEKNRIFYNHIFVLSAHPSFGTVRAATNLKVSSILSNISSLVPPNLYNCRRLKENKGKETEDLI